MLENIKDHCVTSENLSGFTQKMKKKMELICLYLHANDQYNNRYSTVYICFLDASKAFDIINHCTVLGMIIKINIRWQMACQMVVWDRT